MRKLATLFALLFLTAACAWANGHWPAPSGQMRPENDDMLSQLIQQNLRDWQLVGSYLTTVTSPTGLAYDGQVFYAGNWNGGASNIQKIDPNTGSTIGSIPSPASWPGGLAWDGANIWVTDYVGGAKIFKLDPNTGAILAQFPVSYCYFWGGLAWDGANLLMGINGNPSLPIPCKIIKYSPTGAPLDSMIVPRGYISGLEYYDGHIYYSDSQNDKYFKMLWGGALVDSSPAGNGYPSGLSMQGNLLCNLDHTSQYIYKYSLGAVVPPDMTLNLTYTSGSPVPPGGGNILYNADLENDESASVPFQYWATYTQGATVVPAFGPISRISPAGPNYHINRDLTQTVAGSLGSGNWTYTGYIGSYPSTIWTQDNFTFTKSAAGDNGIFYPENTLTGWDEEPAAVTATAARIESARLEASPNPFNPTTTLSFTLLQAGPATLAIYDLSGRQMAMVVKGWRDAGSHQVTFDGSALTSGVYVYRLTANGLTSSAKMVLMK